MNDKQPAITKIIWNDYGAFISMIFCLIAPGMYLYDTFFAKEPITNMVWIAAGIFAVALVFLGYRYTAIISLFNNGLEAKATISEIGFFRDRGTIKYIYPFNNQKYASQARVMKNRQTTSYRIGDEIVVMVDRENPKKSLIKDLFM